MNLYASLYTWSRASEDCKMKVPPIVWPIILLSVILVSDVALLVYLGRLVESGNFACTMEFFDICKGVEPGHRPAARLK